MTTLFHHPYVILLIIPRLTNAIYFYDPSYKYVTTTFCTPSDDDAQLWLVNDTSHMVVPANDTS